MVQPHLTLQSKQTLNSHQFKTSPHLLHGQLDGGLAVGELHLDAGALHLRHHVLQPLRLLQHLAVAAAELAEHAVGHVRNVLGRVAQSTPQRLQEEAVRVNIVLHSVQASNQRQNRMIFTKYVQT